MIHSRNQQITIAGPDTIKPSFLCRLPAEHGLFSADNRQVGHLERWVEHEERMRDAGAAGGN